MFMNDSSFDDDGRKPKRGSMTDTVSDAVESLSLDDKRSGGGSKGYGAPHPNSLKDDEDIESIVGGDDYLSGSRTNVIQQQRDLQKKKLQERMGGGIVRTSLPKQYSAPRSMDVDDKPSRFGRDDDDDDDVVPVRQGRSSNTRGSPAVLEVSTVTAVETPTTIGTTTVTESVVAVAAQRIASEAAVAEETGTATVTTNGETVTAIVNETAIATLIERIVITTGDAWIVTRPPRADPTLAVTETAVHRETRTTTLTVAAEARTLMLHQRSRRNLHQSALEAVVIVTTTMTKAAAELEAPRKTSRSASPDFSSDDERNDDNAATTYDPSASKPRGGAVVKKPKLDMGDMKAFLLRPIPKAYDVLECYIERNKSGANKMFPEYCLYMKEGDRFLLTGKKRPKNRTSNYLISMQRGDLSRRGTENYVGKLRANFLGTEFAIYDNGVNPKDADTQTITSNPAGIRQELGISMYAANVLGHRGPRKMKVCVPRVREDGTRVVWRPLTKEDEMINKCKEQDHTNLTYLINKPPRWNDQVCAYVLNFNGRVTMASVKNFQLVTPEDQETVVLQFGRVGKDLFTMDFRWPLCPLQAFAITLSSFDSKLACE
ncbi:hypothetical protein Gpo141_00003634 [Globisporangium polare]